MTAILYINERSYPVGEGSIAVVEAAIVEAVRAGGSFVDVPVLDHRSARVLVTPASAVRIGERASAVQASIGDDDFPDLSFFDL